MCWLRIQNELGNFLFRGYASTRGYESKLLVFVVFCRGAWIIERGNFLCAGYASTRGYAWLRVKIKVKSTGVCSVLSWILDHRTKQFLMSWLRVYAWLRVKIKAKGTGVRSVLSRSVDHRTRQFVRSWLRVYAWFRVVRRSHSLWLCVAGYA